MRTAAFLVLLGAGIWVAWSQGTLDPLITGNMPRAEDLGSADTGWAGRLQEAVRSFGEAGWGSR